MVHVPRRTIDSSRHKEACCASYSICVSVGTAASLSSFNKAPLRYIT